jgi:hypothetical protein
MSAPAATYSRLAALLVILVSIALAAPSRTWMSEQVIGADDNLLDDSYRIELPARLVEGELSGRDFAFPYGPLRQVLGGLGWLVPPHDLASVLRFEGLGDAAAAVLALWVLLRLTGAPLSWCSVACLVCAAFTPSRVKPLVAMAAVAALAAGLGRTAVRTAGRLLRLVAWAAAAPLMISYSFDLGLFTLGALLVSAAAVAAAAAQQRIQPGISRSAWEGAACASIGVVAFFLALGLLPGWSHTLPDILDLTAGYAVMNAYPLSRAGAASLLAAAAAALFVARWAERRLGSGSSPASRPHVFALLATSLSALLWLRYGLTRSDPLHVFIACSPALLVLSVLLPCHLRSSHRPGARPALAAGLAAVAVAGLLSPPETGRHTADALTIPVPRVKRILVGHLGVREALLRLDRSTQSSVLVWPYETIVNVLAHKKNPVATLQLYSASTERFESRTVKNLEAAPETPVILLGRSWPMDEIENSSRNPIVFRYLLDHYELDGPPRSGVALLRPSASAPRWTEEPLAVASLSVSPVLKQVGEVPLPAGCCGVDDFLLVRLRLSRTRSFGLFKPGRVWSVIRLDRDAPRLQLLAVPQDGDVHTVLLSAVSARDPAFFAAFESTGGRPKRERLLEIAFRWVPMDFLSLTPERLSVEGVSVLHRAQSESRQGGS